MSICLNDICIIYIFEIYCTCGINSIFFTLLTPIQTLLEKIYLTAVLFTSDHLTQTLTEFVLNYLIKNSVVSRFVVVNENARIVFNSISVIIYDKYSSIRMFSLIMSTIAEWLLIPCTQI
jgi:hypothetical protein